MSAATYTLNDTSTYEFKGRVGTKHRRGVPQTPTTAPNTPTLENNAEEDGTGSLTYSAASSINSAGESTDSSFADIMRVLDMQDSKELAALMKKEGMSAEQLKRHMTQQQSNGVTQPASGVSVSSSLNYSTDGESALDGSHILQTITGQPSDSHAFDGGGFGAVVPPPENTEQPIQGDNNILFAPAEPADSVDKKKKEKKEKKERRREAAAAAAATPKAKNSSRKKSSTPPPSPRESAKASLEDDNIWYAAWWMSCFPDAFKELMPKR